MNTTRILNVAILAMLITTIGVGNAVFFAAPGLGELRTFFDDAFEVKWLADYVKSAVAIGSFVATTMAATGWADRWMEALMCAVAVVWCHPSLASAAHAQARTS